MNRLLLTLVISCATSAFALENTKTLPKGVRNLMLRTVDTDISQKTNRSGDKLPLSEALEKDVTFKKIIQGESSKLKQEQIRSFLVNNGFGEDEAVGNFTADLNGHIRVFAPVFAYGITDKLTLASVFPIYSAQTSVQVGFKPNERGQQFIAALANPENNLVQNAREAAEKLNNAVGRLNEKLENNGYRTLEDWHATGLGDTTLMAKYAAVDANVFRSSVTGGFVAPTGRVDNPDVLNDIAFGDGQWDIFSQLTFDQNLPANVTINEFVKYTNQLPGKKNTRLATEEEPIEVPNGEVDFKLGDKVDYGLGVQYEPQFGLLAGAGLNFYRKFSDRYHLAGKEQRLDYLERDSAQSARYMELMLGYSTIPAFKRGEFKAPMEIKLGYLKQLKSENMPITDFYQLDASLFF